MRLGYLKTARSTSAICYHHNLARTRISYGRYLARRDETYIAHVTVSVTRSEISAAVAALLLPRTDRPPLPKLKGRSIVNVIYPRRETHILPIKGLIARLICCPEGTREYCCSRFAVRRRSRTVVLSECHVSPPPEYGPTPSTATNVNSCDKFFIAVIMSLSNHRNHIATSFDYCN